MLYFNFQNSTKILFGQNKIQNVAKEIKIYADRILLVYGGGSIKQNGLYDSLCQELKAADISYVELAGIQANPRIDHVRAGVDLCRQHDLQFILAVGGGSVIDCSKLMAAGFYYEADPWDFMIYKAKIRQALPIGTILTIAATGSEMNGNAVISNDVTSEKLSVSSSALNPVFSILDPTYSMSLPPMQTAAGIADIMSHVCEQYFSANPGAYLGDRLGEAILNTCIHYGPLVLQKPEDYEARANLMWAGTLALNGMLAAGKSTDWATHGMEHEVSALYDLTHGVGLAILTPAWMRYVLQEDTVEKFSAFARNVWKLNGEDSVELALKGIQATQKFFAELGLPERLSSVGVRQEDITLMAKKAVGFGPIGRFKVLEAADIEKIYQAAY